MVDSIALRVKAGAGGPGAVHFRRERFMPKGGPDGGDGGSGGSVVLIADAAVETFREIDPSRLHVATSGKTGGGEGKHGAKGTDLELRVPVGTLVYQNEEETPVGLLNKSRATYILVKGGRGGRGNKHFATATHQVPRFAEQGLPGEEGTFRLELSAWVDVALVGFPNAGKSSLLAACTRAKPKISDYPFTTVTPEVGVAERGYDQLVIEELPGLPEGTSEESPLKETILGHANRAKVLVHVVSGEDDASEKTAAFRVALERLQEGLSARMRAVVLTKIDLPAVRTKTRTLKKALARWGQPVFFVSSVTGEGIEEMVAALFALARAAEPGKKVEPPVEEFRPGEADWGAGVRRAGDGFVLEGPTVPALVVNQNTPPEDLALYLRERLRRSRWRQRLERAGVKPGDKVRVGDVEIEW